MSCEDNPTLSDEEFAERAKAPLKARNDEGSIQERSVEELIKANAYGNPCHRSPFGITLAKVRPGGTV